MKLQIIFFKSFSFEWWNTRTNSECRTYKLDYALQAHVEHQRAFMVMNAKGNLVPRG